MCLLLVVRDFKNIPEFEFVNGKMFDRETIATVNYASSTINNQGNVSGVRINVADGVVTNAQEAGISVKTALNQQSSLPSNDYDF